MHFLIGILVFAVLVKLFPRATLFLVGAAVVLIVAVIAASMNSGQQARTQLDAMSLDARFDASSCGGEVPILVTFRNGSSSTVTEYTAEIIARVPGYSDVISSTRIRSDKIIGPGASWAGCWAVDADRLGALSRGVGVANLTWSLRAIRVTF